jgi:prepilin-type N-terminal cleavage/methylation domain-containing protein
MTASPRPPCRAAAFTLVELLVVMAILAVLVVMAAPVVSEALAAARQSLCAQHLHQVYLANVQYAGDHGRYVAAAPDLFGANLTRWHGARTDRGDAFDPARGPLRDYLGTGTAVRACPALTDVRSGAAVNAFERACGGYGYNHLGIGSTSYQDGYTPEAMRQGMAPESLAAPAATVMFADTAFPQPYHAPAYLIEYSFAEPYHFLQGAPPREMTEPALPSIHFRHRGRANVAWAAGQVTAEPLAIPGPDSYAGFGIGWFGGRHNRLFDPY